MRVFLWVVSLSNLALASCALWAAITASSSLRALRRKLAERSTRSLRQLDAEVSELSSQVSSLSTTTKRISSRIGMQDVRARRKAVLDPSRPMTKAELRAGLATGELRVLSDQANAARRSTTDAAESGSAENSRQHNHRTRDAS